MVPSVAFDNDTLYMTVWSLKHMKYFQLIFRDANTVKIKLKQLRMKYYAAVF